MFFLILLHTTYCVLKSFVQIKNTTINMYVIHNYTTYRIKMN